MSCCVPGLAGSFGVDAPLLASSPRTTQRPLSILPLLSYHRLSQAPTHRFPGPNRPRTRYDSKKSGLFFSGSRVMANPNHRREQQATAAERSKNRRTGVSPH